MNKLKELRSQAGLSLRKLQSYVGIDFSRLAFIEKNDCNIEQKTLSKLCSFFRVNYSYFYGSDGLIDFYDPTHDHYFPLAYEQFKSILSKANINYQIVNNNIRRILSEEDINKIDINLRSSTHALEIRMIANRIIEELDSLNTDDVIEIKKQLDDYFINR